VDDCGIRAVASREMTALYDALEMHYRVSRLFSSMPLRAAAMAGAIVAALFTTALLAAPRAAQPSSGVRVFHIRETAGIRRTAYPVTVPVPLPRGALADAAHARIMTNSAEVAAQFTARQSWDDGSVQTLDIDFSPNLDPEEDRRYELQFGSAVTPAAVTTRGLTVVDQPDAVVVGTLKFSKSGSPQLVSVSYRGEGIGTGQNGLTVTDMNGRRIDLSKAQGARLEVLKGGPLMVSLHYTATLPIDESTSVPVDLVMEMPSSKSWLKTTVTVTDRSRKVKDIAIERPYAWSGFPVVWDFGTDSGTYGVFQAATDAVTLTQTSTESGPGGWRIETGPPNQRRVVEMSAGSRNKNAGGWGHVQDAKSAVAFAIPRFGRDAGTYSIALTGAGQATFRVAPAGGAGQPQITVYEHFVSTPVAIGAATNPMAMLTPIAVTVER
jgi:hypothetical protein